MFSGRKTVDYEIMSICFVAAPFLDTKAFTFFVFFSCLWSSITLSRCRCRKAKKVSHAQLCRSDVKNGSTEVMEEHIIDNFKLKNILVIEDCFLFLFLESLKPPEPSSDRWWPGNWLKKSTEHWHLKKTEWAEQEKARMDRIHADQIIQPKPLCKTRNRTTKHLWNWRFYAGK